MLNCCCLVCGVTVRDLAVLGGNTFHHLLLGAADDRALFVPSASVVRVHVQCVVVGLLATYDFLQLTQGHVRFPTLIKLVGRVHHLWFLDFSVLLLMLGGLRQIS